MESKRSAKALRLIPPRTSACGPKAAYRGQDRRRERIACPVWAIVLSSVSSPRQGGKSDSQRASAVPREAPRQ
jgi:hypothetical protein